MSDWQLRPIDPDLERRYLAEGWWDDRTLGRVVLEGLEAAPGNTFAVHSTTAPWSGTFADVALRARRLAAGLRARGFGPGDPIAFQLPNSVEACVTFYAAALLGAVVVPIVHFYGPKEVGYILRRTGVRGFVSASSFGRIDFLANMERLRDELDALDLLAVVGADPAAVPVPGAVRFDELDGDPLEAPLDADPTAAALIAYTSGTTADPKGVIHSHRTIGFESRQLGDTQAPGAAPNLVGAPVGHAIGMLGALLTPLHNRGPVQLVDVWDPAHVLRLVLEHGISAGNGSTYFLTSILDHPDFGPEHLEHIRHVGLGGSAIPLAVSERAAALGISIVRMYGSTEHPSITGALHSDPEGKRHATDGHALPGVEVRLDDDGEILSRGPDLCMGYTDPKLNDAFDEGGWYRTEDIGVLDDEGWLRITDRKKDIIIRGGENVSAAEVEEVVARVAGVAEVAVVAAPDERLGERVCAVVRVLPGAEPPTLDALRTAAADAGLARQKWPEQVEIVDDLPRTPSGKVKKADLRRSLS